MAGTKSVKGEAAEARGEQVVKYSIAAYFFSWMVAPLASMLQPTQNRVRANEFLSSDDVVIAITSIMLIVVLAATSYGRNVHLPGRRAMPWAVFVLTAFSVVALAWYPGVFFPTAVETGTVVTSVIAMTWVALLQDRAMALKSAFTGLVVGGVTISLTAIGLGGENWEGRLNGDTRIGLGNLATRTSMTTVVAAGMFGHYRGRLPIATLLGFATAIGMYTTFVTFNKRAILSIAVALIIVAIIQRAHWKSVLKVAAVIAVATALSLPTISSLTTTYVESGRAAGLSERPRVWKIALGTIAEKPYFGHGTNATPAVTKAMYARRCDCYVFPFHAHNDFLQIWLTLGIVGLAAAVLGYLHAMWASLMLFKRRRDISAESLGLLSSAVGLVVLFASGGLLAAQGVGLFFVPGFMAFLTIQLVVGARADTPASLDD